MQFVWIIGPAPGLGNCGVQLRFDSFNSSKQVSSFEVPAVALAIGEDLED
jgi:hypothetical protein